MTSVQPQIESSWGRALAEEFQKESFIRLKRFLQEEKSQGKTVYPPGPKIFSAFDHTPFDQVKVVLLGQDPYHGPGQAHGLCFSVPHGNSLPPSLLNVYKELRQEFGWPIPRNGNLEPWAKQGVLLLNATLTVEAHQAGSHQKKGWEEFTDQVIRILSREKNGLVFLLWGRFAQAKAELIDGMRHCILTAAHPSPFSADRGFFGCRHFSKTNEWLIQQGKDPIDWQITD